MAVLIGKYILKSNTTSVNDYAVGIALPLQMTTNTFEQTYDNITQLKSNIKNLLLTVRGERLSQPNFGCGLQELLFDLNTPDLEEKIYNAISSAIEYWIPQVQIQDIEIQSSDSQKDTNSLEIKIRFVAAYNQQPFTVDFKVNP